MSATFMIRFKAFLIDYLLILTYLAMIFAIGAFLFPSIQELFNGSLIKAQLVGFLMVTFPISIYFVISDSVIGGQSFGKKKMGIRVVNENGTGLTVRHAIFRTIFKFLPWELSHYLVYRLVDIGEGEVPIYYFIIGGLIYVSIFTYMLTAIFTKKKQSLYDIVAGTQVVKVKSKWNIV
ncbi:RDD family protein [Virgibacillus ndiopensis]|uniref:RDD family protein n=1 Tax=Virgibacillus ndiopensis TaxID=2004408 RepID=UPI000C06F015|nr:RDD family protein [Virgibacillus ndiopensis]